MSQANENTQKVFNAIKQATDNNAATRFRSGDVSQFLRDGGFPLGSWEIRAEFTALSKLQLIALDAASATWHLTEAGSKTAKIVEVLSR